MPRSTPVIAPLKKRSKADAAYECALVAFKTLKEGYILEDGSFGRSLVHIAAIDLLGDLAVVFKSYDEINEILDIVIATNLEMLPEGCANGLKQIGRTISDWLDIDPSDTQPRWLQEHNHQRRKRHARLAKKQSRKREPVQ